MVTTEFLKQPPFLTSSSHSACIWGLELVRSGTGDMEGGQSLCHEPLRLVGVGPGAVGGDKNS